MKGLYKTHIDCGRMGTLHGLFVAEVEAVNKLIESKREIVFGEVLGRYSNIYGTIEPTHVTLLTTDEAFIAQAEALDIETGINPFNYIDDEDDDTDE